MGQIIDVNANKTKFESMVDEFIKRDGVNNLMQQLEASDFFTAPASSRYHGDFNGGLALHSMNVFKRLLQLNEAYKAELDPESVAIVALFHDLCKVFYYKESTRNVKNDQTGQWSKVPFYKVEEAAPFGGHGSKSVFMVQSMMPLTFEEAAAINCHMGPWDKQDYGNPGAVFENSMLAWLLHVADEAATYMDKT